LKPKNLLSGAAGTPLLFAPGDSFRVICAVVEEFYFLDNSTENFKKTYEDKNGIETRKLQFRRMIEIPLVLHLMCLCMYRRHLFSQPMQTGPARFPGVNLPRQDWIGSGTKGRPHPI